MLHHANVICHNECYANKSRNVYTYYDDESCICNYRAIATQLRVADLPPFIHPIPDYTPRVSKYAFYYLSF